MMQSRFPSPLGQRHGRTRPGAAGRCLCPARYEYVRNTKARTVLRISTRVDRVRGVHGVGGRLGRRHPGHDRLAGRDRRQPEAERRERLPIGLRDRLPQGFAAVHAHRGGPGTSGAAEPPDSDRSIRDDLGSDAVRVLEYDDALVRDGYRGLQMVVQVQEAALLGDGQPAWIRRRWIPLRYVRADEPGDAGRRRDQHAYILFLLCSADCYARNRGDIHSAIDSWTVLP